ncbi:MAG TPA: DNA alkylation repair protein [Longimicrobium sp.]|nr:DNA alkylation repair protein [Longimicrobium sp.]
MTDLEQIRARLRELGDAERAAAAARYLKAEPGGYGAGDRFLGIRVPALRAVAREFRHVGSDEATELLRSPWHEERLVALLLLMHAYDAADEAGREATHRVYLDHTRFVNNWDLVDTSASQLVGRHLDGRDLGLLDVLARSELLWERRIAIIATFYFIRRNHFAPTLRVAGLLVNDAHDLIHKAVGWMLREVGKRDRSAEEVFLREHCRTMPRTMLRYAIEHFPPELRSSYMRGV